MLSRFTTISARIGLAMALLGSLLVGIGAFGFAGMMASNNANRKTYAVQMPKSIAVGEMVIFVGRQRTTLDRAAIQLDANDARSMYVMEKSVHDGADAAWQRYLSFPRDATEDQLAAVVTKEYDTIEAALAKYQDATASGNRDEVVKLRGGLGQVYMRLQSASDALKKYQLDQARDDYQATERAYTWFRIGSFTVIGLGAIAAFLSWLYLRRAILTPVNDAIFHFEEIARGDLSREIVVRSDDEMGRMMGGLVSMQGSLIRTAISLREGSDAIATATREIAAGNTDLSARTESQAASLEETAASAEQLAGTVRQNADNAARASALSSSASDVARKGHDVVARAVSNMGEISRSSKAISEITTIIEGIAFQTNILALNAAVEAARAGEQGRGFAVVAGEVRTLAQRSAVAAKEIKELISNSTTRIDSGAALVSEAGATMNEVIESIGRVNTLVAEIASASSEQSHGLSQVSTAVNAMDNTTQQNAALVEEAAAAAQALQHQASRLAETAATFKLAGRA
ncbi:methyl-accepting chemotaxis sensory transducer with TarH sensor [Paraburkholderia unamae]|uniref:methyl-accepting chemotaxis protein n=1 Tax=Paraburkholderia unamae TaxID=219649 RepID=UPI000DC274E4|nr:methyl-accepting chemotaxis protein [Paraburkholderia unamae]RAR57123.1 methyl-accepting chemotaxis sensory transducer with TarH sensor [Paraburkholderia unamae]